MVMEFIMRLKKMTETKACYAENMDRIGRIYLPIPMLTKMNIKDELIVQLAPDKSFFSPGGYTAQFVQDKETIKKMRFAESIEEKGELGFIYVGKNILEILRVEDELAVRVVPPPRETGGVSVAQNKRVGQGT